LQQALFQCAKQSRRQSAASVVVPQQMASTKPIAKTAPSATGLLEQIEAAVTRSVAEVFEMSEQQVAMGRVMSFRDFGADSILSAELIAKINASLQLSLKTTAIFNYPGVKELSRHIHAEFGAELAQRLASASGLSTDHPQASSAAVSSSNPGFRESALPSGELAEVLRQLETGQLGFEDALARYVEEV
jgi:acyl carrier protein